MAMARSVSGDEDDEESSSATHGHYRRAGSEAYRRARRWFDDRCTGDRRCRFDPVDQGRKDPSDAVDQGRKDPSDRLRRLGPQGPDAVDQGRKDPSDAVDQGRKDPSDVDDPGSTGAADPSSPAREYDKCGAIVTNMDDQLLVVCTRGDKWGLPKGGRRAGETRHECAEREVYEETSVRVAIDRAQRGRHIYSNFVVYVIARVADARIDVDVIRAQRHNDSTGVGWIYPECLRALNVPKSSHVHRAIKELTNYRNGGRRGGEPMLTSVWCYGDAVSAARAPVDVGRTDGGAHNRWPNRGRKDPSDAVRPGGSGPRGPHATRSIGVQTASAIRPRSASPLKPDVRSVAPALSRAEPMLCSGDDNEEEEEEEGDAHSQLGRYSPVLMPDEEVVVDALTAQLSSVMIPTAAARPSSSEPQAPQGRLSSPRRNAAMEATTSAAARGGASSSSNGDTYESTRL
jgi:8-oxo-dGTP pyrophosphatase MutT (NUDIX family)